MSFGSFFFIKTLKMGIIYTLHFFLQYKKPRIFFLVALQVLPFQKFVMVKISHGGPSDYIQFEKNWLKFIFLLYKAM